ncbi:MAG: quinone-dependent dihydroorotate dehydrogenase [Alphaproteobacteria bacterium]|nr:quinone-dependent dihydroorotate dehydrogenase [Alphaproteobacteria bacterium]OJV17123.1 MAG: dihydroorotate dehydrogenase (quinone) [Alphaproteobacteria bacterium 33-17]
MQLSESYLKIASNIAQKILFTLDPETAHDIAINLLSSDFVSQLLPTIDYKHDSLKTNVMGINFKNPIGLAAGFDKNARIITSMAKFGFGFVECGTVTKYSQLGNPKPRIFRLVDDQAIINALGFNNRGYYEFIKNISQQVKVADEFKCNIGVNIGKNKNSRNAIDDYTYLIDKLYDYGQYITINISSPNTPGLRDLQNDESFNVLLEEIVQKRNKVANERNITKPLVVKIAPDLDDSQIEFMADRILHHKIDGIIISNTTIGMRHELKSKNKVNFGGLSGAPLFNQSNYVLGEFYKHTKGQIPIIGAGGVFSADDAFTKIAYGASLVQIYTGFIYKGFTLVNDICKKLPKILEERGFANISEAVGHLHK